jgi:hypothetical protein
VKYWKITACSFFLVFVIAACNTVSVTKVTDIHAAPISTQTPKATLIPFPSITAGTFPTITEAIPLLAEVTPTFRPKILAEVATLDTIISEKPELKKFYDRPCITYGNCAYVADLGLSPNGDWAAFFSVKEGASGGLSIVNIASKKEWNIYYYDITGESCCAATVRIERWSHDGRYLYVSPQMPASGGLFWFWRDYIQLIRMNLENGTWIDTKMGSSYSFSLNDKFIAFRRGATIVIHEFQTGDERLFNVPTEYVAFGRFEWSQDNKKIIFVSSSVQELETDEGKPNGFTLFLLDVEKMKAQIILEKDERYLYPLEWQTPEIILLESLYKVTSDGNLEYNGEKYKLVLKTNEISKYEFP